MPLPTPNLDDRSFEQLLAEARERFAEGCPEWTDRGPSDPGTVLLELFAHLTETLLYRLNQVPDKAYVEFLRLIGVTQQSPSAARARLVLEREPPFDRALSIPRNTPIHCGPKAAVPDGEEAPVFLTAVPAEFASGASKLELLALHCEVVEGELVGTGTGAPSQFVRLAEPPVIAPSGDAMDLSIGVEVTEGELEALGSRVSALEHGGKRFRVWTEVAHFTGDDECVFVADRAAGLIYFAPSIQRTNSDGQLADHASGLAEFPGRGREIRAWYRRGGGLQGNVAAGTLALVDGIEGVSASQPHAATGGHAAETLHNARLRGPQEFHRMRRAVTARDYEALALDCGGISRAKAYTRVDLWSFAAPGTVELLLVPSVAETPPDELDLPGLRARMVPAALDRVREVIEASRPLGTECVVRWAAVKQVSVRAMVFVHAEESPEAVKQRIVERLSAAICPLPATGNNGWPFGKTLHVSDVYHLILSEPGVAHLNPPAFLVDDVPDTHVRSIERDPTMPRTWYASSGERVFRSQNDGDSWELAHATPGEQALRIECHPSHSGVLALLTQMDGSDASRAYISSDCGESWTRVAETAFTMNDAAWIRRDQSDVLLIATDEGLQELTAEPGATPIPLLVDPSDSGRGFNAVTAVLDAKGTTWVAAAATDGGIGKGIWLSDRAGMQGSFESIGLDAEMVRVLRMQREGPRTRLWAGIGAIGPTDGSGCHSYELSESESTQWRAHGRDWKGGSCRDLAVSGAAIFAATTRGGVLRLASHRDGERWESPAIDCGLPLDGETSRLAIVDAVAATADGPVFAGGPLGLYERSGDGVSNWLLSSRHEYDERITLPQTWLFASGAHSIVVEHAP